MTEKARQGDDGRLSIKGLLEIKEQWNPCVYSGVRDKRLGTALDSCAYLIWLVPMHLAARYCPDPWLILRATVGGRWYLSRFQWGPARHGCGEQQTQSRVRTTVFKGGWKGASKAQAAPQAGNGHHHHGLRLPPSQVAARQRLHEDEERREQGWTYFKELPLKSHITCLDHQPE